MRKFQEYFLQIKTRDNGSCPWPRLAMLRDQRGFSLIQMLVSVSIMAIGMLAMMTMFSYQENSVKGLKEKLAVIDFQQQLLRTFSDGMTCTSLLNGLEFDSTNAIAGADNQPTIFLSTTSIPISAMPSAPPLAEAGQLLSAISGSVMAASNQTFQVLNIAGASVGGFGNYSATFQINLDNTQLTRSLIPPSVQISLRTSSVGTTQRIIACRTNTVALGSHTVTYATAGSYNFIVPPGVISLWVRVLGAGGGGAGNHGSDPPIFSGGGGGSGGYVESWISVSPGQVISLNVGAGGSGGAPNGNAGGMSSLASLSASGGGGGVGSTVTCTGGAAGVGIGGQLNLYGSNGGDGNTLNPNVQGGHGASSAFGGGGRTSTLSHVGSDGLAPGSGGGGAWGLSPNTSGGDGKDGIVVINY